MAGVLSYALSLNTSAFTGPLKTATGALRGMAGAAGSATRAVAGLVGKIAAIAVPLGAAGLAFKAFTKAADFESLEVGFTTVLGSATAAKTPTKTITKTSSIKVKPAWLFSMFFFMFILLKVLRKKDKRLLRALCLEAPAIGFT